MTPKELWHQVLERLQVQVSLPHFENWIETCTILEFNHKHLIICAPNSFILNRLQKKYLQAIAAVVEDILGYPLEIQVTTLNPENISTTNNFPIYSSSRVYHPEISRSKYNPVYLNPKYTFSRFVVGPTNRMAHAASLAVAESPGRDFNPLFLCGKVGLGKTHLMQAIGHYRLDIDANSKVFYVSTEQFTNDLITAIRRDSMQNFREHYRAAHVLLIDDIQFIEGKEYTQEEFFHTFNTLYEAGKQVVLAADRLPQQMPGLQARLSSRFSMGLIADIQVPDLETRMAILQKKAEYENINLNRDVIEYIARNYASNIRELEGALIRAVTYISLSGLAMNVENIAPILNPTMEKIVAFPEVIMEVVATTFKVKVEDLKGSSRRREISFARQVAMYLMRQHTELSLPRIGEEFGGKDHTTVMYSCEKISQLSQKDQDLKDTLRQLSDRINLTSKNKSKS